MWWIWSVMLKNLVAAGNARNFSRSWRLSVGESVVILERAGLLSSQSAYAVTGPCMGWKGAASRIRAVTRRGRLSIHRGDV